MPNERTIPSDEPKSVCTFTILSEGNQVSATYQVLSIVVNKEVNRIPSATIIIIDGAASEQTFAVSNTEDFAPGKNIEIKAGYRANEETIFRGIVIRHGIKIRNSSSVLMIECKDAAVKMTAVCKSNYYKDVTDSDVMETIIDKHGLDKDVVPTTYSHGELVQYNATDWDFILCRADMNGLLCLPNDGKLTIAKPDFGAATALTIQYGSTVHDLDAEVDARLQFKEVKAIAWSSADQAVVTGEASEPAVPEAGNLSPEDLAAVVGEDGFTLQHSAVMEETELQEWASAKLMKDRLAKIRGKVRTDGTSAILPGQMIELQGVGERFEGKLFVTGVRHEIDSGNWQTVMQFGINPEWFAQTYEIQQPMAGAMLPAIEGLQIGVVTKLEGDPLGENRIMVRLPVIQENDEGIWSRVSTLDAGNNRGTFFLPEIGDEVIVGFINNDPRYAVILGMVNSSNKPAPLTASDANDQKGYVSRSGMKMLYDDDKKIISIETPAGNKITLSEEDKTVKMEDQNGNSFSLDNNGMNMHSTKKVSFQSDSQSIEVTDGNGNSVKLDGSGVTVTAASKVTINGSTVELTAGSLTINAGMAQFSGVIQAQTVIATAVVASSYTPGAGNIM
ncbi:type VI secretion system tip protein VgrG [Chitinophagaceae bacterium MMS25-I14]